MVDLLCTLLDGVEEMHHQPEAVNCKIIQGTSHWSLVDLVAVLSVNELILIES